MNATGLTLGEYIRRLRKKAGISLFDVAQKAGLAYTHLSRIENDSTVPGPDTVVKLAEALNGDLKVMLELANCLPRAILDRIAARATEETGALRRAAYGMGGDPERRYVTSGDQLEVAIAKEAEEMAEAISLLPRLRPHHQKAVVGLIKMLYHEGDEPTG